jgi:hypothetical protein
MSVVQDWREQAVKLSNTGVMSRREIAEFLNVPRSTCLDYLRAYYKAMSEVEDNVESFSNEGVTHLVIPDSQVRPGISLDYLRWIGEYIVKKQPEVIVHLGDFCDFEALSQWDEGKLSAEGKRVIEDINVSIKGMRTLLQPLFDLQAQQKANGEKVYRPRMVLTLGNHEDRLTRYVNSNSKLEGFLSLSDLKYEEFGWEVVPFLTPINIDGINYCHYFPNVMTGRALTGTAQNMLKVIGESFTMGHRQTLDVTTRFLPSSGAQQWGLVCGAAYVHEEHYKGKQGNHHWRGVVVKHRVKKGSYDPLFVSMQWLEQEYGAK